MYLHTEDNLCGTTIQTEAQKNELISTWSVANAGRLESHGIMLAIYIMANK